MVQQLKVPSAGESVQEVQIGQWLKKEGQWVEQDEPLVELETDKASLEVAAPVTGVLEKILKREGEAADVGEAIALINDQKQRPSTPATESQRGPLPEPVVIMPAAQRLLAEHRLQAQDVQATGPQGRLLKEDVLRHIEQLAQQEAAAPEPAAQEQPSYTESAQQHAPEQPPGNQDRPARVHSEGVVRESSSPAPARSRAVAEVSHVQERPHVQERHEQRVPMSLIRRRIAQRLVQAQQVAALLTTFNEVDMSAVIQLRSRYQEAFRKKHGVKLGFMSFFTRATVEALKEFPALNAEISGQEIIYRNYCDMGIAISSHKGLVVPVLRDAGDLSLADIERRIAEFAERANSNKLKPDELDGGTFTITNGGVFGSLLSTPIVNAPQSGVLGLHAIQDRPVARDGQVVICPMMYIALTYDHRIVDGREAVTFLRRIKELIEDPARLLIEV